MKKLSKETVEFLIRILNMELATEEDYQSGNCNFNGERDEHNLDYAKDLIRAKIELLNLSDDFFSTIITKEIIDEDLSKFSLTYADINKKE